MFLLLKYFTIRVKICQDLEVRNCKSQAYTNQVNTLEVIRLMMMMEDENYCSLFQNKSVRIFFFSLTKNRP